MHLYIRVCMKDFGSLIWFVFQWSAQKKTCCLISGAILKGSYPFQAAYDKLQGLFCLLNRKGVINLLNSTIVQDLVGVDCKLAVRDLNYRVAGQPVLASLCNVILLHGRKLIILGTRCRVYSHVKRALRIRYGIALYALNGVAVVVLGELIQSSLCRLIPILRIQSNLLILCGIMRMIPVIVIACRIQLELIAVMRLTVAAQEFGTAVGVIMSLKNDIHIILIKDRRQLRAEDHSVGIGMIQSGAVDILMDGDNLPFCIRIRGSSLLHGLLMLCHIVVVGVQYNEERITIAVIVVPASLGCSVIGCIGYIEM